MPNFILVGSAKAGTTSLYNYLAQHPQVFMPHIKEPHFLCFADLDERVLVKELYPIPLKIIIRNFRDYQKLFSEVRDESAIGEASTAYLFYHDRVIENIRKYFVDTKKIKICMILRNPIDAAYSYYLMYREKIPEKSSFERSLQDEKKRLLNGYLTLCHTARFFYFRQVKAFKDNFSDVWISLYDDLKSDPVSLIKNLYSFLGLNSGYLPDTSIRHNSFLMPKDGVLHLPSRTLLPLFTKTPGMIRSLGKMLLPEPVRRSTKHFLIDLFFSNDKPPMNPYTREHLKKMYCEDIIRLQDLIGRDLSSWLK